jgi:hypothetical protein
LLDASAPDASYFKELDPEAILPGEGTSIEFPTHIFPINANPRRAVDGLGPLDWFLQLNKWSPKTDRSSIRGRTCFPLRECLMSSKSPGLPPATDC